MMRMNSASFLLSLLFLVPTVGAESPIHPDEGLKHLNWQDARSVVNQQAFVYGEIIRVGSSGTVNFLNVDTQRPARFTFVVFERNLKKFPKSLRDMYLNKKVRVRGRVSLFKDKPQIIITSPDQIEILDELPDLPSPTEVKAKAMADREGDVVLATYNVLNLFDDEDDPYRGDEGTPAKTREELTNLAKSIAELNADVIAFQEVENRFYLQKFVDVFLPDLGYEHVVHYEGNDGRGIDVCLISRLPIGPVRSYRHLTFPGPDDSIRKFNRDILAVSVEPPGGKTFEVWVVHLKSNSGGREFAEPVRLAECRKLRELLDEELAKNPEAHFAVVGDFNDTWDSETLKTIVGEGATALWSCSSELGNNLPDTYNVGKYQSMIDFILCSPAMAKAYVKNSFEVIPGSPESTGSDHNPVVARFELQ